MANGIAQSFIGGVGQANQLKSQQLAQQQQRAEYERFLDKSNLTSMVQAGLEFRTITDPVQQDAYLKNRIAGIKQRGGDSRDTEELLALPPEERKAAVDNLINIGERFGVIKADATTAGVKFGQPRAGITPTGEQAFFQTSPTGETKRVEGFSPVPKQGETIETLPGGGIRITRGGAKPKKFTETQAKTGGFATRVRASNEILTELEDKAGFSPEAVKGRVAESIPFIGNMLIGEDRQVYNQAKSDFITAVLRLESGAAIADSEFVREDKKWFPQPGDSAKVISNKRKARERQFKILKGASGGAFEEIEKDVKQTVIMQHPTLGDVTEDDIRTTMKNRKMTRQQVLDRLQGQPAQNAGLTEIQ